MDNSRRRDRFIPACCDCYSGSPARRFELPGVVDSHTYVELHFVCIPTARHGSDSSSSSSGEPLNRRTAVLTLCVVLCGGVFGRQLPDVGFCFEGDTYGSRFGCFDGDADGKDCADSYTGDVFVYGYVLVLFFRVWLCAQSASYLKKK